MLHLVLVAIGGFCGAIARYRLSAAIGRRFPSQLPYGTLSINLLGSLLLGFMAGHHVTSSYSLLLGTGFMGAFTTFSTFKLEAVKLGIQRQYGTQWLYLAISYTLGIACALLGFYIL